MNLGRRAGYADAVSEAAPAFQEESFFEYHLYNLDGTTTIRERETKQMELLGASGVGVERRLIFDGSGTYFPFFCDFPVCAHYVIGFLSPTPLCVWLIVLFIDNCRFPITFGHNVSSKISK